MTSRFPQSAYCLFTDKGTATCEVCYRKNTTIQTALVCVCVVFLFCYGTRTNSINYGDGFFALWKVRPYTVILIINSDIFAKFSYEVLAGPF